MSVIAMGSATIGTLAIDGQPPGQTDNPRAKRVAVSQPAKVPMRSDERFLSDILGVLTLAKDPIGDPKGQA
jgi:hypothetical protein